MKVFLFLIVLIPLSCFSGTKMIAIDEYFSDTHSSQNQSVYKEGKGLLTADDIMKTTDEGMHVVTTSSTKDAYWIKFTLVNTSAVPQKIILEHPRAGLDFIDLYLYQNHFLSSKSELGDMRPKKDRAMIHFKSAEMLTLEPHVPYTIISRLQSYGPYELSWNIKSLNAFTFSASIKTLVWGCIEGILIALMLYNAVLYFSTREIFYLVYGGYAFSLLIFQFIYEGFAYQYFHIEHLSLLTVSAWIWIRMIYLFLFLTSYYFFQLQKELIGKLLFGFAAYEIFWIIFYSAAVIDMDILYVTAYTVPVGFMMVLFMMFVSILVVVQKRPGSFYFAIARGFFTLCSLYNGLVVAGYIKEEAYAWLVLPFGIVMDLFFLSLAHGEKIKQMHQQQRESENLLIAQSRFIALGQTVGNITHQWKTPIAQLASQFMFLHATFLHKKESLLQEFEKKIPQILYTLEYVQSSIDLFSNFFKHYSQKSRFNPIEEVRTIEKMLEVKLILHSIEIKARSNIETIYTHKNALINSLMVLCETPLKHLHSAVPLQNALNFLLYGMNRRYCKLLFKTMPEK